MRQMEAVKKAEARMRVAQQAEMESHVVGVRDEVARTILTSERLENKLAESERKAAELARSRSELVSELAELKAVSQHPLNNPLPLLSPSSLFRGFSGS